jgi:hypothetical protein
MSIAESFVSSWQVMHSVTNLIFAACAWHMGQTLSSAAWRTCDRSRAQRNWPSADCSTDVILEESGSIESLPPSNPARSSDAPIATPAASTAAQAAKGHARTRRAGVVRVSLSCAAVRSAIETASHTWVHDPGASSEYSSTGPLSNAATAGRNRSAICRHDGQPERCRSSWPFTGAGCRLVRC